MKALLIDTATNCPLIALFQEDQLIYQAKFPAQETPSSLFATLLEPIQKDLKELDFIALGVGPGSYTGIRVGASFAKGLSYSLQIPLVKFSSLQGFIPQDAGSFLSVIDARIGGLYILKGEKQNNQVHYFDQEILATLDQFYTMANQVDWIISSETLPIEKRLSKQQIKAVLKEVDISPYHLFEIAKKQFLNKDFSLDGSVSLTYLRKTQAEIEKEQSC